MKCSVQKKHWLPTFLWSILFCFLALPEIKADQNIALKGSWDKVNRSVSQVIPITAIENDVYLTIETTSTLSDITIRIVKDGNILYEETLYQPQMATIIPLDFLDPGTYRLELTNQWGGYLYGTFEK